ncbi:hypothetical protein AK812_SmicGene36271 [Symbiodinium microadriaticum]|uniref:Uncharacterized protein n=1 Tax=Symbiodinium microadriaticum TaxID=2951 RepID=A0A1Q9CJD2_SYMMI|nr:hypothetical protein AK812_SmicGene36271 [Symbiodinium microadriaticum]
MRSSAFGAYSAAAWVSEEMDANLDQCCGLKVRVVVSAFFSPTAAVMISPMSISGVPFVVLVSPLECRMFISLSSLCALVRWHVHPVDIFGKSLPSQQQPDRISFTLPVGTIAFVEFVCEGGEELDRALIPFFCPRPGLAPAGVSDRSVGEHMHDDIGGACSGVLLESD